MEWPSTAKVRHLVENVATSITGSRFLPSQMQRLATGQSDSGSAGQPAKIYRGSRRRLKRITFRGNWSPELLIFVVWLVFCLLVLVPWLVRHPPAHGHETGESQPIESGR